MNKFITLLFIVAPTLANAQVYWDFATASPTSGVVANSAVSDIIQGNNNGTTTLISAASPSNGWYAGASGGNNAAAAIRTGSVNPAPGGTTYYETTITPSSGYKIVLTAVNTGHTSTNNGPTVLSIRSSIDGYFQNLFLAFIPNGAPWSLVTFTGTGLTAGVDVPVTLRIFGSGGLGSTNTANWRIDDLKITYTSTLGVLPVTVSSFTGSYTNKTSFLKWNVGDEININKYVVERSTDGRTFTEIGFVNSTGSHDYSYTDASAKTAVSFYRLRIVGLNELKYSAVVKVLSDAFGSKVNIYPSPAVNYVNAEFTSVINENAKVQMTDASGRIVMQKNIPVHPGYNNLSFDVNTFNKGIYILKITVAGKITSTVFNKL